MKTELFGPHANQGVKMRMACPVIPQLPRVQHSPKERPLIVRHHSALCSGSQCTSSLLPRPPSCPQLRGKGTPGPIIKRLP